MRRSGVVASSIRVPSYSVSPSVTSVNEGSSVTLTVSTVNVFDGTTLYWTTEPVSGVISSADFTDNLISGSLSVSSGTASLVRGIANDAITEGPESFRIQVRTGSTAGPIVATSATITINDTSQTPVSYSVSPNVTSVNEGGSVTFSVSTVSVPNGTVLYWSTQGVTGTINASDFTDNVVSGSFTINASAGSVVRGIRNDATTEGSESFRILIRTGSTGGTVVATSSTVTINDTSTTPAPPPAPTRFTKTYSLSAHQNYWNSGSQDNRSSVVNDHIQGTFNGTTSSLRRNLMVLPFTTIRNDLSGASIVSVRVRMRRLNTGHGSTSGATVRIHTHSSTTIIASWTGTGITQRATSTFTRGQERFVTLPNSVGTGLANGTINGLAISTTSTSINEYSRMEASRTLLEIVYDK